MAKLWVKTLNVSSNPSGAASAARSGNIVVVVDVIDMSTTAEAALEAGVIDVLGASPDNSNLPVTVNPEKIAYFAGKKALKYDTEVVVAAEPRYIKLLEDYKNISQVKKGIERAGSRICDILPNIGKETVELVNLENKILLIVSSSGGAVFDAAFNYGAPEVITGTIARTTNMKGVEPAKKAAERAIKYASRHRSGISIIAASSNSIEDVLAAEFISKEILKNGFLNIDESD